MRVAIMTDEVGWHTRQLQAALRARGAVGRCVDLADCRVDTTQSWHGLLIPGSSATPDAALATELLTADGFGVEVFDDLADLLVADPIHDVDQEAGWPHRPGDADT